jgi:hypothetical protein
MPRVLPRFSGGLDVAARAFFQAGRARFISAKAMSRPWPRFIARSIHSIAQGSKSRALCSGPASTRPEAEIGEERRDRRALGGIVAGEEHHRLLRVAAAVLHIAEAGGVERLEHRRALGPGGDLLPAGARVSHRQPMPCGPVASGLVASRRSLPARSLAAFSAGSVASQGVASRIACAARAASAMPAVFSPWYVRSSGRRTP